MVGMMGVLEGKEGRENVRTRYASAQDVVSSPGLILSLLLLGLVWNFRVGDGSCSGTFRMQVIFTLFRSTYHQLQKKKVTELQPKPQSNNSLLAS
jgi:hypothetical protein